MKYCSHCGVEVNDDAVICIKCGGKISGNDRPNKGLAVLSFLFPIVGLILYLIWISEKPKKAKSCGKGALISILTIFIVVTAIVIYDIILNVASYRILNETDTETKKGKNIQSDIDDDKRPQLAFFDGLGDITVAIKEPRWFVSVKMVIGYDMGDNTAENELTGKAEEINNFLRDFFGNKTLDELQPENEGKIKMEIKELLSTKVLDNTTVRLILFDKLDIFEE
jgi:flagellar basal body-associated protein FliL